MSFTKFVLSGVAVIGLSACSAFQGNNEVSTLQEAVAVGSPFTQQLTSEYRALSSYELDSEKDYADALHFARKGLASAKGISVMPEPVNDWDLTASEINELSNAYARLISAYDRGSREILPGKSAIAQARYDCWIEEQEEIENSNSVTDQCKNDFMAIMTELEAALPAVAVVEEFPEPVTMIDTNEPLNIQEAMYLVFFDFDKSNVNADAQQVVDTVVNEMMTRNIQTVRVVGHTDTSGSDAYNAALANRRATSVRQALQARGVDMSAITIESRGEQDLLVQTTDGTREPANRRAVITFE